MGGGSGGKRGGGSGGERGVGERTILSTRK